MMALVTVASGLWLQVQLGPVAGAIGLAGFSTYRKGLAALMQARLNINALMTVAVTGAFLIGQWPEAAMVMALYAIAELIEGRAVDRARNAIKSLLALTPDTAEVRQSDGSWASQPAADVPVAATVRVKPGARIPLDGAVTSGTSAESRRSMAWRVSRSKVSATFSSMVSSSPDSSPTCTICTARRGNTFWRPSA